MYSQKYKDSDSLGYILSNMDNCVLLLCRAIVKPHDHGQFMLSVVECLLFEQVTCPSIDNVSKNN